MQDKIIVPTNLGQRTITPKPGQTFRPFTVYEILATDGIKYETTERSIYDAMTIGKEVNIKFEVKTTSRGGRVYTNYKIADEKKERSGSFDMTPITAKLDEILSILRSKTKVETELLNYPPDDEDDTTQRPKY